MLKLFCREMAYVDAKKDEGIITGIIGQIFLLLPVCWYLHMIIVPPPSDYEYVPPMAGTLVAMLFFGASILGIIFAGLTKKLLKRSIIFGTLFISSGLLNLYLLTKMFSFSGLFGLLLYAPPIISILVGVSLMKQIRMLVTRQNIE